MADRAFKILHDLPTLSFSAGDVRSESEFPAWQDFDRLAELGAICQLDGEPLTKAGAAIVYKGQIAKLQAENEALRKQVGDLQAELAAHASRVPTAEAPAEAPPAEETGQPEDADASGEDCEPKDTI